jgi:hypothetical protein
MSTSARLLEKQRGRVEVLEVGFGYGRVLLELSWLFRDRVLTPFTSRIVLRHDRELIPLTDYVQLLAGGPFVFRLTPKSRCILQLDKLGSGSLSLGLRLNEQFSASGRSVPLRDRHGEVLGGYRTVYDVSSERYQELLDREILQPLSTGAG